MLRAIRIDRRGESLKSMGAIGAVEPSRTAGSSDAAQGTVMAQGFLGTRASLMLDVIVCSLVLVVPTILYSLYLVRYRKNYELHRKIQIALVSVLVLVVILFEVDMRLQGGFWELAKDSSYVDTVFLRNLLYVHLFFSISNAVLWPVTLLTAIKYFPRPASPAAFSPKHKLLARVAVADMAATVVTGLMVYYYGFIA